MLHHRPAVAADLDLLAALNAQLIQDEGHSNPMGLAQLRERMAGWLATEYRAVIFEQDGQPAAYALYRMEDGGVYLRHFFVARDYRRRGLGRAAIRLLVADVLPAGVPVRLDVLAANGRGLDFWRSVGFAPYSMRMVLAPPADPA